MTGDSPAAGRRYPWQDWLRRAEQWALPGILILAFALRVYRLGDKNIWWDEGFSLWVAWKDFLNATLRTAGDVHPPLYYWQLWPWIRLAGDSEFAARFITAIWGVLTVALVYPLGMRLGGRRAGLLAALFLAVARFHIWWSQEMRMHVLATLAATATLYLAVRWPEDERARSRALWPVLYALAAASCLYSFYLAGVAPLAANLYALPALARIPRPRRLGAAARWLAAQVAALALFAPWALLSAQRMQSWSATEPFSFRLLLELYATALGLGISTDIERYLVYLVPLAAVLTGGFLTLLGPRRREEPGLPGAQAALLLIAMLAVMPGVVYLATRPRSLFHTPRVEARYLLLSLPAFSVLLAWSVVRVGRRSWALGLAALAACLGVMAATLPGYYAGRHLQDEMQSMVRILAAYARPDDAILLISGDRYPLFHYYYDRVVPPARRLPILGLPQTSRFTADDAEAQLAAATAGRRRFWVVAYEVGIQDPLGLSLPWFRQHYTPLLTYDEGRNGLVLYGSAPERLLADRDHIMPQRPLAIRGGDLQVWGYDLPVRECQAGEMVNLGLYWTSSAPVRAEVQWLRDDGQLLRAEAQDWPANAPAAERAAFRFAVAPSYRPGGTHFLLRWRRADGEGAWQTLRLAGPRILPAPAGQAGGEIAHPLDVAFAGGIRLRGYDLHRPLQGDRYQARPGEALTIDLYWEAGQPVAENYTVFTHVLGSAQNPRTGGPVWGQHDGAPGDGRYATRTWAPGELVVDRHVLQIEPDAPVGEYELEIGLYLPATLARLQVVEPTDLAGADRVVLARLQVSK